MLKYVDTAITFAEIPDEITLCINLSRCPCKCANCHSSYLADDIGEVLTITRIEKLIKNNSGITAICFMGGDNDPKLINHYAKLIKDIRIEEEREYIVPKDTYQPISKKLLYKKGQKIKYIEHVPNKLKIGWYSGRQELFDKIDLQNFDYIKIGPYKEEYGPLNSKTTNQKFYKVVHLSSGKSKMIDITHKFWKNDQNDN